MNLIRYSQHQVVISSPKLRSANSFSYAWTLSEIDIDNDATSTTNFLTTDDTADPITYLTFDPAIVSSLTTFDTGGGVWLVTVHLINHVGTSLPMSTEIAAHDATFDINYPGYVYGPLTVNFDGSIQVYYKNGVITPTPFDCVPGDVIDVDCNVAGGTISLFVPLSDNRMAVPVLAITSGNGFIFGGFDSPHHGTNADPVIIASNNPATSIVTMSVSIVGITVNFYCGGH